MITQALAPTKLTRVSLPEPNGDSVRAPSFQRRMIKLPAPEVTSYLCKLVTCLPTLCLTEMHHSNLLEELVNLKDQTAAC